MQNELLHVTQADGHITDITCYNSSTTRKGSILILHGMAEHYERYEGTANFLSNHGYDVYLYSHRGHGTHLSQNELGFFAENDGYKLVIQDAIQILKTIRQRDENLPLFLMGHSMGSIITRNVIQEYDSLNGVIICGTANPAPATTKAGLLFSTLSGYKRSPKKRAPLTDKMMFSSKLYANLNKRTPSDWLCTDEKMVDQYIADPYCGFVCTKSFYHDLLMLTKNATMQERILRTNKSVPLFIISGSKDPVGGCGKDVVKLIEFYRSNGYQVTSKLYDNLRHEILNEPNKEDILNDLANFLDQSIHLHGNSTN